MITLAFYSLNLIMVPKIQKRLIYNIITTKSYHVAPFHVLLPASSPVSTVVPIRLPLNDGAIARNFLYSLQAAVAIGHSGGTLPLALSVLRHG